MRDFREQSLQGLAPLTLQGGHQGPHSRPASSGPFCRVTLLMPLSTRQDKSDSGAFPVSALTAATRVANVRISPQGPEGDGSVV